MPRDRASERTNSNLNTAPNLSSPTPRSTPGNNSFYRPHGTSEKSKLRRRTAQTHWHREWFVCLRSDTASRTPIYLHPPAGRTGKTTPRTNRTATTHPPPASAPQKAASAFPPASPPCTHKAPQTKVRPGSTLRANYHKTGKFVCSASRKFPLKTLPTFLGPQEHPHSAWKHCSFN